MNIREIKVQRRDSITISTTDGHVKTFKKENLSGPKKVWFDNIIACSKSLMSETPTK